MYAARKLLLPKAVAFSKRAASTSEALQDLFGRNHNYLRMSLTERCNLRCQYCMPEHGVQLSADEKLLTLDERKRLIDLFASLGVTKLRFTGGEPTVSKHLRELISHAKKHKSIESISITTNGVTLIAQIPRLMEAGLTSANISLDTLDGDRYAKITRRSARTIDNVIHGIFKAREVGLNIKINCVAMRGVNDDELGQIALFGAQYKVPVRFIEVMPFDGNAWDKTQFISYYEIIDLMKKQEKVLPTECQIEIISDCHSRSYVSEPRFGTRTPSPRSA